VNWPLPQVLEVSLTVNFPEVFFFSLNSDPQPVVPGTTLHLTPYPLISLAWGSLPGAYAPASIVLRDIEVRKYPLQNKIVVLKGKAKLPYFKNQIFLFGGTEDTDDRQNVGYELFPIHSVSTHICCAYERIHASLIHNSQTELIIIFIIPTALRI
jgi:hypothetical protein